MVKEKNRPTDDYEKKFWFKNASVAGVDEAGRGALAGPVVAAAVILSPNQYIADVNDSKILTPGQRESLFIQIYEQSISAKYCFIENDIIDDSNILKATFAAMKNAILMLEPCPNHLLIDGNQFISFGIPFTLIIHGDALSISIASASIVAKVARDKYMVEDAHSNFPEYGFDRHKGYGTRQHFEAIKKYGLCPLHRKTFLKKFFNQENSLFHE